MNRRSNVVRNLLLTGALAASVTGVACEQHYYRVYDPYYTDYHSWDHDEDVYYHRWADETHRDANRDFRKLRPEEQKEYWTWRHNHDDHDGDHH
jgi:protein-tyrosine phosphatase